MAKNRATSAGKGVANGKAKARAAAKGATGGSASPDAAKSNGGPTDNEIKQYLEVVVLQDNAVQRAAKDHASARKNMQDAIKNMAAATGISKAAIKRAIKERLRDAGELTSEERDYLKLMSFMDQPIGTQLDMLGEEQKGRPSEFDIAMARGVAAGRAGEGKMDEKNPYNANHSDEAERARARRFDEGWAIGQGELGSGLYSGAGKTEKRSAAH